MVEIIRKIGELYDKLLESHNNVKKFEDEFVTKMSQLKDKESCLDERGGILDAREKKVKGIEDLVALETSNNEKLKESNSALAQLVVERNAFSSYSDQVKTENAQKNKANEDLKKILEGKQIVLDEGIAKLAEDRKTMRADIISSLK